MKLLALALLAYALIKFIRSLPNTPESQPEPDDIDWLAEFRRERLPWEQAA